MKRIGSVFCLVLLMITMTASVCFGAQDLKIEKSYPRDAQENTSKENMGVKLWFNNDMGNKTSEKANKKAFSITDSKGNKIPIRVFYNPKDSKEVMVLADAVKIAENKDLVIKDNAEYTLHISGDVTDNEGNTLGKEQKITFKTMNQAKNTQIYMVMMVIMFGAMFMFSSRQAKKKMEEERTSTKEEPFNPYKEAKRTGKSVDEVIAAHEKEMEKKAKKAARHAKPEEDDEEEYEEDNGNYKVKGPRPITAGGGTYITGRKALAEARKAEEERLAKRRAANAKGKKKKK
ncbi:MAG: Ig-like domain-containing protein [Emergencia sp.]|nr:Ig-like domain-containing protein [Emergencia sp.]